MVLIDLQKILSTLGLVSSIAKPIPVVGGVIGGLLDTAGVVANSTAGNAASALGGLLGGSTGLIAAVSATGNAPYITAYDNATESSPDASTSEEDSTISSVNVASDNSTMSITDDSCSVTPYSPSDTLLLQSFAPYDAEQALIYRYRQQQSVNLGSWFVQEQWMNPSLFTCASGNKQAELDVASGWGGVDSARQVLERHWDEWITEKDFAYLAGIGIFHL